MVEAFEHLAERAFADSLLDFESVSDVIFFITDILSLIIVKPPVFWTVRGFQNMFSLGLLTHIDIVDLVVFENL